MNTLYFVYALEVAKAASISQAASNLFMSQSTLSKSIKDLEGSLGFPVFHRTSKGVIPTQKGQEFLEHAQKIVAQIEKMERSLNALDSASQTFSLAIYRAGYMANAAAKFLRNFDNSREMELDIRETNSLEVIDLVSEGTYVLGVIRYHMEDEEYFLKNLAEKGLQYESIWQSRYVAVMPRSHPLAQKERITPEDLLPYVEIRFGDSRIPYVRVSSAAAEKNNSKRILIYDRAMQVDLLQTTPLAYMYCSPAPAEFLERAGLVQRRIKTGNEFKDLLISRAGYRFSKLDRAFINELTLQKNAAAYSEIL